MAGMPQLSSQQRRKRPKAALILGIGVVLTLFAFYLPRLARDAFELIGCVFIFWGCVVAIRAVTDKTLADDAQPKPHEPS
jgi:hypothetical protein